jgi:hypothetical protein
MRREDQVAPDIPKPRDVIEEAPNEDEIETPRVEVAAMKLEMP